ncbi:TPA: MlaD family protein [Acinetobacter baumannii]|uniref:PqiB family protein n=1 Tax=Acinetobacter baumannii TaxID=470 RepID=UPI0012468DA8|nr:MlaD family protein [Acinetobacter baumannii]KAB1101191.1 MCE family protein [Acinetobacter baumannii]MCA4179774.1 MlaD family protein [Acinetobacter baumannii]MCV4240958.1 MlaD family protein [Acinetobacter baumannii]MCZ3015889.1 MlaD family protein [Acinetobacter baumannii]MDA4861283.1 MlaD family protein [Acinetobacter baumannii]
MSMSENKTTSETSDHHETDVELENMNDLPEPQEKKNRWKPLLIWIIPLIALLIALSLAVKALLSNGPTIEVSFRTAEGLVAGKTTVRYKQVDIGVVRQIDLAEDRSHIIARIDLRKDASNFAAQDSRFWVVRPRIGTSGVSGIDTLLSGSYIEVDGGKSPEKKLEFTGLEIPPVITSDVPGKEFFLKADDLGSLDIGSPIYYRRINVGQITAYKLSDDGKSVELQTFIRAPYDKFVTTDTRFWQASGIDVTLNASGFNLDTQSLASIVAGGIAFGFPENSNATVAANKSRFNLWDSKAEALKEPDGLPRGVIMYFDHSLRGLAVGAPIDFMGIEIGSIKSINAEFYNHYKQIRMRVEAVIYPSRVENGQALNPNSDIFKDFVEHGWRAQMRTGNLLTGQNYIALDKFPKAKPATLQILNDGRVVIPTTATELSGLQAQVSQIADKLTKFPLVEIGQDVRKTLKNMNTAIESTDKLVKQLDGKVAPGLQATLDDVRKTVRSSESILSSDAPLQQDVRKALQQMTRAAASLQLMADYIEQHPESIIRGKRPEANDEK